jgi:hypothetical protein
MMRIRYREGIARKKYLPTFVGKRLLGRNIAPRLLGRDCLEEISPHDCWGEISSEKSISAPARCRKADAVLPSCASVYVGMISCFSDDVHGDNHFKRLISSSAA